MSIQAFDALHQADRFYNEGRSIEALSTLHPVFQQLADNYWANFLMGKIFASIDLSDGADVYLKRAVDTHDIARIGAITHLAARQVAKSETESAALIDDVLKSGDEAGQNKYYLHKIHFIRAVIYLLESNLQRAEDHLRQAYGLVSYMPEEVDFNNADVRRILDLSDLDDYAYLSYLKYRYTYTNKKIDYGFELTKMPEDTFVVEIGAMDGIRFDALREPITNRGWSALLVEPLPDMFTALQNNYKDYPHVICCNAAITDRPGVIKMYRIPNSEIEHGTKEEYVAGISSMHKTFLIERSGDLVVEQDVEGITFDEISKRFSIKKIDVLQIDTEGHDLIVLENVDIEKWKIPLIQVEVLNLMPPDRLKVFKLLDANNYQHYFDGSDVTALLHP